MDSLYPSYELPANSDRALDTLRAELEARGLTVGRDTTGIRRDLYVGTGSQVSILFEFKAGIDHASDSMYQGRWDTSSPRRVAVIPSTGRDAGESLEHAGIEVLSYQAMGDSIVFPGLDDLLARSR